MIGAVSQERAHLLMRRLASLTSSIARTSLLALTAAGAISAATPLSPEEKQQFSTAAIEYQSAQLNVGRLEAQFKAEMERLTKAVQEKQAALAAVMEALRTAHEAEPACQLNAKAEWICEPAPAQK